MQIEGDKNSALPAADIHPDGQTKGFNQPNKEETHARLSKHTLLDLKLCTRHQ